MGRYCYKHLNQDPSFLPCNSQQQPTPVAQLTEDDTADTATAVPQQQPAQVVDDMPPPRIPKTALHQELAKRIRQLQWKSVHKEFMESLQKSKRLSDHDIAAVVHYTALGYQRMNKVLRNVTIDGCVDCLKVDDRWDESLPVHQGTVYRGSSWRRELLYQLQPGAIFADPGFLSTSTDEQVGKGFKWGSGGVLFEITSKTGQDVSKHAFGPSQAEAEVLFRPNTMFRITSVERTTEGATEGATVKMEELC
ncbi:NAD:arginine ADP-ribosyltransferase [Seminavis robusta]|uniref:NAD:arginine ADP-ribosyltransferase n=1 Tax=Seminavis robusta TaxID=568900 RepID=A0A9N8EYJ2_9STRA|nr:NAD:arginine ADP-ribosyltransferase [Seminavis robusta]|eukprot:Sro2131_g315870.1 NAD:arginine ADP-ribosyltransferase (250) ;mRNA; r:4533-5426